MYICVCVCIYCYIQFSFENEFLNCRCFVPGFDDIKNQSLEQYTNSTILERSIPWDTQIGSFSQCFMYDINSTSGNSSLTVKCKEWVYDTSVYQSTIVSEVRNQRRYLFIYIFIYIFI